MTTFSVYKECEGGPGAKHIIELLKAAGIEARKVYSPYVGQIGVQITTNNKRLIRRAERIVWGD